MLTSRVFALALLSTAFWARAFDDEEEIEANVQMLQSRASLDALSKPEASESPAAAALAAGALAARNHDDYIAERVRAHNARNHSDSCSCLNWKSLYASKAVKCGQGFELTDPELQEHPDVEMCANTSRVPNSGFFFPRSDHTMCLKVQKALGPEPVPFPGYWCYVSAECQELRGGNNVNQEYSYKKCDASSGDVITGDLPPAQLFHDLAEKDHLDYQTLALMAYKWAGPAEGQGALTRAIYDALNTDTGRVGASEKFDYFTVIRGAQIWEVQDEAICVEGC